MQRTLISIAIATALTSAPIQAQVLEEVMVTAQKREQSANDVGLSVTAFSNQQMEALGIEEATDVMASTPGATLTTAGQGIPIYTIRGAALPRRLTGWVDHKGLYRRIIHSMNHVTRYCQMRQSHHSCLLMCGTNYMRAVMERMR